MTSPLSTGLRKFCLQAGGEVARDGRLTPRERRLRNRDAVCPETGLGLRIIDFADCFRRRPESILSTHIFIIQWFSLLFNNELLLLKKHAHGRTELRLNYIVLSDFMISIRGDSTVGRRALHQVLFAQTLHPASKTFSQSWQGRSFLKR